MLAFLDIFHIGTITSFVVLCNVFATIMIRIVTVYISSLFYFAQDILNTSNG